MKGDQYECIECGYLWNTRKEKGGPPRCPKCNSVDMRNKSKLRHKKEKRARDILDFLESSDKPITRDQLVSRFAAEKGVTEKEAREALDSWSSDYFFEQEEKLARKVTLTTYEASDSAESDIPFCNACSRTFEKDVRHRQDLRHRGKGSYLHGPKNCPYCGGSVSTIKSFLVDKHDTYSDSISIEEIKEELPIPDSQVNTHLSDSTPSEYYRYQGNVVLSERCRPSMYHREASCPQCKISFLPITESDQYLPIRCPQCGSDDLEERSIRRRPTKAEKEKKRKEDLLHRYESRYITARKRIKQVWLLLTGGLILLLYLQVAPLAFLLIAWIISLAGTHHGIFYLYGVPLKVRKELKGFFS